MNNIEFQNFPYREIVYDIKAYTDDVKNKIDNAVKECTELGMEYAEEHSPVRQSGRIYTFKNGKRVVSRDVLQPGTYKKKWRSRYNYKNNGRIIGTFYNASTVYTHYDKSFKIPLSPLLELGHEAKNPIKHRKTSKKRRKSNAKHFVEPAPKGGHIQRAEDLARAELDKKIKTILNK